MMRNPLILVLLLLCIACDMPKLSNKEVAEYLKNKYNTEFRVETNAFHAQLNLYQYVATCEAVPQVKAYGEYNKNGEELSDKFSEEYHNHLATQHALAFLGKAYSQVAVKATVASHYKHSDGNLPIDYESLLKTDTKAYITVHLYLFDTVEDGNASDLLNGALQYAEALNQYPNKVVTFSTRYWSPGFLEGKSLEQMNFGFDVKNDTYSDSPDMERAHIQQALYFEFASADSLSFGIDDLHQAVVPYTGGILRKKVFQ